MNLIIKKTQKVVLAAYFMLVFSPKLHASSYTGKFCASHSERIIISIILGVMYFIAVGDALVNFIKRRNDQFKGNKDDNTEDVAFLLVTFSMVLALCMILFRPNTIDCKFY